MRQRLFLLLSVAIIAAFWTSTATHLLVDPPDEEILGIRTVAAYVGILTAVETLTLWALLRGSGERFADLGFGIDHLRIAVRNPLVYRVVGGVLVTSLAFGTIVANLAPSSDIDSWLREPEISPVVAAWLNEPHGVLWMIALSIVGGGFREELERAFCLTRFERAFGPTGLALAVVVDTVLFGAQHSYQGNLHAVFAGATGLVMALLFLRSRRVADAMVAHAVLDVVMTFLHLAPV